jgi:hypothetical protein
MRKLFTLLILSISASFAMADCQQDRHDFYHNQKAEWNDQCGEHPDADYLAKLKADCSATVQRIEARNGASWNSEYGWAFDSTCEALERGDEL